MSPKVQRRVEMILESLSDRGGGPVRIPLIAKQAGLTYAQARHALFVALEHVHFWDFCRVRRGSTMFYATKSWLANFPYQETPTER